MNKSVKIKRAKYFRSQVLEVIRYMKPSKSVTFAQGFVISRLN